MKPRLALLFGVLVPSFVVGYMLVGARPNHVTVPAQQSAPESAPDPIQEPTTPRPPPRFTWARIESADYAVCVANLRAVSCPERTIIDILRGQIQTAVSTGAVRRATFQDYANYARYLRERMDATARLDGQVDSILYRQLNLKRQPRSAGVLFTAQEEEAIAEARSLFPAQAQASTDGAAGAQAKSNKVARLDLLSRSLSPEKMLYYKLDREGDAPRVQSLLSGLEPTREEFLAVAAATDGKDLSAQHGQYSAEATAAVQSALPPERFAQFQDLLRPEYQAVLLFGRINRLPRARIKALLELRRTWPGEASAAYQQGAASVLQDPRTVFLYLHNAGIHPQQR
jgi:hypothetical protein